MVVEAVPADGVAVAPMPAGYVRLRRINPVGHTDPLYFGLRLSDAGEVAIRVFARAVRDAGDRNRFRADVAALGQLADLPHMAPVRDAGFTEDGRPFVVTDYCRDGSLQDQVVTAGRLPAERVCDIGVALAQALDHAHRHGIVHRRIKPTNVLVDAHGDPVLTDFGLVSLSTADGRFMPPRGGSRAVWAAPEAYLPELATPAADVYSLGATLYVLAAGWRPRSDNPFVVALDGSNIADLPRVPFALMSVIRTAMAIDPRRRFPDGAAMADALLSGASPMS